MLEALLTLALLSVTDPPGDAGSTLTAPTAAPFGQRSAFDLRRVTVADAPTLRLSVTLAALSPDPPEALLEFYLQDPEVPGTAALLPGSALRLPPGATWRYAVRVVGERAELFDGTGGAPRALPEGQAALSTSGDTLSVQTDLELPRRFSLYGMSGSYDPFSPTGWREVRETPSPWGFSGVGPPVLDVVSDTPAGQERALAQGTLPEIRASFSRPGWLLVAGAGALLALAALAARLIWGRDERARAVAPHLSPFSAREVRRRARLLRAFASGRGQLEPLPAQAPEETDAPPPEPVLH